MKESSQDVELSVVFDISVKDVLGGTDNVLASATRTLGRKLFVRE
jgi:hypothetical protein